MGPGIKASNSTTATTAGVPDYVELTFVIDTQWYDCIPASCNMMRLICLLRCFSCHCALPGGHLLRRYHPLKVPSPTLDH